MVCPSLSHHTMQKFVLFRFCSLWSQETLFDLKHCVVGHGQLKRAVLSDEVKAIS